MYSHFVVLALAVGAPNLKETPKKEYSLVGRWACTACTFNGKADPLSQGLEYEFTADGTWVAYQDGKETGGKRLTYKADVKAGAVDLYERADGVPWPSLFEVDGDTLNLATRLRAGDRPANFEPGMWLQTFTFRRVKAKD